ncbi:hypothetical protein BDM02DRAFT_1244940 [Thelephora ganbajun]|uniref:Uncharacterized protein n=1 Tax=Thelephora ganbajun TaxID=370292 RepID=A0ACB6Z369_THEGA|nr:hypothetical protein BDM02DRAFT_1244940 [Thelephora ganbajun]
MKKHVEIAMAMEGTERRAVVVRMCCLEPIITCTHIAPSADTQSQERIREWVELTEPDRVRLVNDKNSSRANGKASSGETHCHRRETTWNRLDARKSVLESSGGCVVQNVAIVANNSRPKNAKGSIGTNKTPANFHDIRTKTLVCFPLPFISFLATLQADV